MKHDTKQKALRRLSLIRGQVDGLRTMVDEERYCVDIITLSSAIQNALSGVEDLVLKNHLETHVRHQMKSGRDTQAIKEVMKVYKLAQRKT